MKRLLCAVACVAVAVLGQAGRAQSESVSDSLVGRPAAPLPFNPADWDVSLHTRDTDTWDRPQPMEAEHGADCSPPPATHHIERWDDAVFLCNNHVMTSMNSSTYGVIYLTPNRLVDFSQGEAVIRFEMSTFRSSGRDWPDLWISPYEDHLQLPLPSELPSLNGEPRRAMHLDLSPHNAWGAHVYRPDSSTDYGGEWWVGYENFLVPSAVVRTPFEVRISRTHIKVGAPTHNYWWVDEKMPNLGWDRGVVQFGHHSYTPDKDCQPEEPCRPNTWHWGNVSIEPSAPFTMLKADHRVVGPESSGPITFAAPAPPDSRLRFSAAGRAISVSVDGGRTWEAAARQPQKKNAEGSFSSYFHPIPTGTTEVMLRGENWWAGPWQARDIAIWSLTPPEAAALAPPAR